MTTEPCREPKILDIHYQPSPEPPCINMLLDGLNHEQASALLHHLLTYDAPRLKMQGAKSEILSYMAAGSGEKLSSNKITARFATAEAANEFILTAYSAAPSLKEQRHTIKARLDEAAGELESHNKTTKIA